MEGDSAWLRFWLASPVVREVLQCVRQARGEVGHRGS